MSTLLFSRNGCRHAAVALVLILTVALGACSKHPAANSDTLAQNDWGGSAYVDQDDGLPLSAAETAVLNSYGVLDKKLDRDALNDVAVQFKYFLHRGRPTMDRFSARSEPFLGYARKVFRDHGMPQELAYLAIVESGYNVLAVSPVGATGAWQFMPYTGMKYGLNQDWWMDERLDVYKSAEAAAAYLQKLHNDFGDWHLAVAAYNAGEGKIRRALDATGVNDFFALKRKNPQLTGKLQLKPETLQYVPRFLAVCKIMRNLSALGFAPVDQEKAPPVVRVDLRPGTDLKAFAVAAGMPWEEFLLHNPTHKQYVSHVDRNSYAYVPQSQYMNAVAYMTTNTSDGNWQRYTLSKKDTWEGLSRRSRVPVSVLRAANRGVSLHAGNAVRVPLGPDVATLVAYAEPRTAASRTGRREARKGGQDGRKTPPTPSATASSATGVYVVQEGDSLGRIASQHDMSLKELMQANDISNPELVRVGQKLRVQQMQPAVAEALARAQRASTQAPPAPKTDAPQSATSRKTADTTGRYTVREGDTLTGIARRYNLTPARLMEMNNIAKPDLVRIGSVLRVPAQ